MKRDRSQPGRPITRKERTMPLKFRKELIADERFEAADVFDVNGDGVLDIVSGDFWYEGPDFKVKHKIATFAPEGEYFDNFSSIPLDVNGNGRLDFVTGSWWGPLRWFENPGKDGEWTSHLIAECGNIEVAFGYDVDGDGVTEIVPNTPGAPLVIYKLDQDAAGKGKGAFTAHVIYDAPQGHGLGCGDIAGNGRCDFVMVHGWLEAPADPWSGKWIYHPGLDLGSGSVPMLVADVNGDGLGDLIVGQAHGYGFDWWEQRKAADGACTFVKHPIDPWASGLHAMLWLDIDGDGQNEIVTGKRYRAHCGHDAGECEDVGVYYFKWTGEGFAKHIIDHGQVRAATGCGIWFPVADLRGTGRLDIVAPGKDGLYVFYNEGPCANPV
jgi:hypothetical protein